jgi:Secretion system C-terminal sorting domain/FG-GAP-like repeat
MRILRLLLCAAFLPFALFAQPNFIASLYPPQHGLNIPADAELRVGLQEPLDPASLSDSSIYVWSDITGLHKLTVTLENGNKDLRIVPRHWRLNDRPPFNAGERVTVTLTTRLRYVSGRSFEGFTWHYTVAVRQNRGGDFNPLAIFGGGGSTYFYASDFNGDGWCDLVGNDDGVQLKMIVFLNDQTGRLLTPRLSNVIGSYGEVTDFDKDGNQDIFYGFQRVILNDGTGNLMQKDYPNWPNGQGKGHDFNNDGMTDYVIGYVLSDTLYFGLSQAGKFFEKLQKVIAPIRRPLFYVHGISYDLNNDGPIDFLYVGGSTSEQIPPGFASFQATTGDSLQVLQVFKDRVSEFYGNDLDGDGDLDYAFVYGNAVISGYMTFINDGSGQLTPIAPQQPNPTFVNALEGGDFDGDGDIDLALARSNLVSVMPERYAPDISILLNDGKGNFFLASRVRLPFDRKLSRMLRAVDLDRDGDLDLIGVAEGLFYVVANGAYPNAVAHRPSASIPMQFTIEPIYPNPAQDHAKIELVLPAGSGEEVTVTIFDTTGRFVRSWRFDGQESTIRITWDTQDQKFNPLPNGVYFVKAQMGKLNAVQKLLLLK